MAEYAIYAGIVYVTFFVIMLILVSISDGLDKHTFPISLIVSTVFTLATLGITAMASSSSEWIQDNYLEQPEQSIERIDLEKE